MRPLRLSMTAFGPYAETEVVDFEALAELGLFAVAGRNGSGKTTIFDGLYFALYGSLPGRRATYWRMRSDHADPAIESRVELDFVAHGTQWRVERFPKQQRAKRRGSGFTESAQRATLYRVVDGQAETVLNRISEVNARCHELVGLSGPQFERVALLPQGEFSRMLRESATDRRDLLRALFSSDVFGEATKLLVDEAGKAGRDGELVRQRLDQRLARLISEVNELTAEPAPTGGGPNRRLDPENADPVAIAEAIDEFDDAVLGPLAEQADDLARRARAHDMALQQARDLAARLDQRARTQAALAEHLGDRRQHEADLGRLEAARAAVPVVDIAQVVHNQIEAGASLSARVGELQNQLAPLLAQRGSGAATVPSSLPEIDPLVVSLDNEVEQLTTVVSTTELLARLGTQVGRLQDAFARLQRSAATAAEQRETLARQRVQLQGEHDALVATDVDAHEREVSRIEGQVELRRRLHELDRRHGEAGQDLAAVRAQRVRVDERISEAELAQRRQHEHNEAARLTTDVLADLHRRRSARTQFDETLGRLADARTRLDQARRASDACFDAFIRGTSARLAGTLVPGEPCAVCGSNDHPAPATAAPDATVTATEVEVARGRVASLTASLAQIEQRLEALRERDPDIGDIDSDALADEIDSATSAALQAENAANATAKIVAGLDELRRRSIELDHQANRITQTLGALDEERNQVIGALGDLARSALDDAEAELTSARAALRAARDAGERLRRVGCELDRLDTEIETIDLARLEIDQRQAATHAELQAREADRQQAVALLDQMRAEVSWSDDPGTRLHAAKRALAVLARLRGAFGERDAAADALRRAELTLAEKLGPSPFSSLDHARGAFLEPDLVRALEASTTAWATRHDQLQGELRALADLPDIGPDLPALTQTAHEAEAAASTARHHLSTKRSWCDRLRHDVTMLADELHQLSIEQADAHRLERVAALVKGDNDHNTSLENWVLAAHLRDVVDLANVRLAQSTQQRFQLCVLDDGEHRRGRWGLELAVEDTVTGTRRPTAGLSGGELFQASLALALGLADVVMQNAAAVRIDALFIDEGFGSLDDQSVERVIDLLDDVRSRGATVGVITHVGALLEALPRGITVTTRPDGNGSTIDQPSRAA